MSDQPVSAATVTSATADAGDRATVVFLAPADGRKPRIVLERLLATDAYVGRYDTRVVVDATTGRTVEFLDAHDVPYVIAGDPRAPLSAVERVAGDEPFAYLVSCGWGYLIPVDTIDAPLVAAVNCHSSYLPDYRGPSSPVVQWANGERIGGATVHLLSEQFDDGNILARERVHVSPFDTPRELLIHASEVTAALLRESLLLLDSGYEGIENTGGRYYGTQPWRTVLVHGAVNHLLWLVGSEKRWRIAPRE
ncbi:formyltransferase family protein [Halorarius litoreus]|uniref:formyltransferase family protein n=1 Tax=Halorarius litoreus TaxID=2962676 RepID=UPI0020CB7246|nr:formyltransferase family protein [Halorarius litoreus]